MENTNIDIELCKQKKDGTWVLDTEPCIKSCDKKFEVFRSDKLELFARTTEDDNVFEYEIHSENFKRVVRNYLRKQSGLNDVGEKVLKSIIHYLSDKAFETEEKKLASRAHYDEKNQQVIIDICDDKHAICIQKNGISMIKKPVGMFKKYPTDLPMVNYRPLPAKDVLPLVQNFFRLNHGDAAILIAFMVACLLGDSKPQPILFVTGPQGSAKSSLSKYVQRCIDPSNGGMFTLSDNLKDLAIAVSKRLLCVFDNTGGLKNKKRISDFLCTVVTKGSMSTRTLYTTKEETILEFRSALIINGIDFLTDQSDLLERCVMIEMKPIPEEERKTEAELETEFRKIQPDLLGGLYAIIQQILQINAINVSGLNRMADYEMTGIKTAIAMGYNAQWFQGILNNNIQNMNHAFADEEIVVKAIVELMKKRKVYKASMNQCSVECKAAINGKVLPSELAAFPKTSAAFSRRLTGLKKHLELAGITFDKKTTNKCTEIIITHI